MSKEYLFEFAGTKEDFFNTLTQMPALTYSDEETYYFDDYMIKITNGEIHFGVGRGGHSGGYWYIPTITEYDDHIEFRGTIQYIGPYSDRPKFIDKIEVFFLDILFAPIILLIKLYQFIEGTIRKICNRPKKKPKTSEDRLYFLMENYFDCTRKNM